MLPSSEVLKDRIIRIIAATRFPFIDQINWDEGRRTLVNTPTENQYPLQTREGLLYPSVVVLNPDGTVREVGDVEMEVTPSLVERWRLLSEATGMGERYKKLFVYVPTGQGKKARELLEGNHIEFAGLREWSIEDGTMVTRPIVTPDMEYDHRVS